MLIYKHKKLFVDQVSLDLLCKEFGTPLYVYSKAQLIENFQVFDSAFSDVSHLVCYAIKANANHQILKLLAKEGAGVDITSGGELYRACRAGFNSKKIVYAGIGKTAEEIDFALQKKILMFNVESIEELEQINRLASRRKQKAPIAFRINPDVDPHTHRYITTGKSGSKFGINHSEALSVYRLAQKLNNIEIVGIHSHIGSQITEIKPFHLAAKRIADIVAKLSTLGIKLRYVDLGGGLGISYRRNEIAPSPHELRDAVIPVFKDFNGTFVFEPGRYIVGNTGILLAKVIYRKKVSGQNFLIVDTGMNDLLRPTLYEAYHDILPVIEPERLKIKLDVVGPICESGDFLGKERLLPWTAQGEYLVVKCTGAYGFAMSSQYNSRLRAAEVMVDGKNYNLIRPREKYTDL